MSLPSVFSYIDYRAFLKAWFDAKKVLDPSYSFSTFATESGGSKATLANVIRGERNPRPATLDRFAQAMNLTPSERNFLGALVDWDTAKNAESRLRLMERILSTERFRQVRMAETEGEENASRYLMNWYTPAIRELATLDGFKADPAWVSAQLTPTITEEEAQRSLDTLFDLGLLIRDPDGSIRATEHEYRTESESHQRASSHFHREAIPDLLRSLDTNRAAAQHLVAATLSLPAESIPAAKRELSAMASRLAALQQEPSPSGKKVVYQVAIQLLPLSREG